MFTFSSASCSLSLKDETFSKNRTSLQRGLPKIFYTVFACLLSLSDAAFLKTANGPKRGFPIKHNLLLCDFLSSFNWRKAPKNG